MQAWAAVIILGVFGLAFGSFFNVLIYRLPRGISIVRPGSHCPHCQAPIRWQDNIPLLSYILLLGRCRNCKGKISIQYPLVELFTGLIFAGSYILARTTGFSRIRPSDVTPLHTAIVIIFLCVMLLIFVIDLQHQIIPDELNIVLFILGLISAILLKPSFSPSWQSSLIGMFILSGFFFLFAVLIGGFGIGDVKAALGIGLFFGWQLTIVLALISFIIGGIFAIFLGAYLLFKGKYRPRTAIPFGPYLALASVITIFFGDRILSWYLSFFVLGG